MNLNFNKLGHLARLVGSFDCNLRVNVFQPVHSREYMPSYHEYWEAFRILFGEASLISCTEPLVSTFSGLNTLKGSPCGENSIRITPLKDVLPCVYWPEKSVDLADLVELKDKVRDSVPFLESRKIPGACEPCEYVANCRGGCRSRVLLLGDGDSPDIFCPARHGDSLKLNPSPASAKELVRSQSICTTIVRRTSDGVV
jgi:radical SAM protein with 4Fe4S-binding SPASM domain